MITRTLFSSTLALFLLFVNIYAEDDSSSFKNSFSDDSYEPVSLTKGNDPDKNRDLYIYLTTGIGIKVGGSLIPQPPNDPVQHQQSITINSGGDTSEVDDHYLNYGKGIKIEAGVDYKIMKNINTEFAFQYTGGAPRTRVKFKDNSAAPVENWTETYNVHMFGLKAIIMPSFMFLDLIEMYTGAGTGLFFNSLTYNKEDSVNEGYIDTRAGLGFMGILGVVYPLNEMFDLKFDLEFTSVSFTTEKIRSTNSTTVYHYDRNAEAPNEYQPVKIPGSNVAIRVGIRYKIF